MKKNQKRENHLKIITNFNRIKKYKKMNKIYILLTTIYLISFSCDTPDNSPVIIGFSIGADGDRSDITLASDNTEVWVEYLAAHNNRDYDKISQMNSDDIEVWGPAGQYIKGNAVSYTHLTLPTKA